VSGHKLDIDVQKIAIALQAVRAQMDILEEMVQEALLKENKNE
jgi:hypothetical protein